MSLGIGLSLGSVAARGRGTLGAPDWPEGAVALWLILGQSNAEGWAPWQQDPGKADPALAVPSLTVEERAAHPWLRMSTRGSGSNAGQFPTSSQGIATEAFPRSSGKVYSGAESRADGIPDGTQAFGAEIALVRHVREGTAPAGWRDDADPRLFLFKQAEGSKSVDYFRWGGDGQGLVLDALRQANGTNLHGLAAAKTVLIQGVIFVIGEKDAKDVAPTGDTMAETLTPRFADWVRQLRGALGGDVPIAFCEVIENGAARAVSNVRMAELAGALPNAAVIESQADWTDVGDATHYDAQGQDRLGHAAFGHLRDTYGRPGDGLVTAFPFTGLKPWFHVPPVFIDDGGSQMRVAATPSAPGVVHALSTAPGTPTPSAQAIYDARNGPDAFQRNVDAADVETVWYTGGGSFAANQTRDVHFMLRASDGTLGEVVTAVRGGNVKLSPDLSVGATTATTAAATVGASFAGTLHWALHAGARDHMRGEDVEAMAFGPVQAGSVACTPGQTATLSLSGLSAGTTYTLFVTGRRSSDGLPSPTQKVQIVTP